jgi:hypothetical protein
MVIFYLHEILSWNALEPVAINLINFITSFLLFRVCLNFVAPYFKD